MFNTYHCFLRLTYLTYNNPMIREMLGGVMKQNNNSEYLVNVKNGLTILQRNVKDKVKIGV